MAPVPALTWNKTGPLNVLSVTPRMEISRAEFASISAGAGARPGAEMAAIAAANRNSQASCGCCFEIFAGAIPPF
jgi:hypothetical protein